jgi:hypothetical protein
MVIQPFSEPGADGSEKETDFAVGIHGIVGA